MIMNKSDGTFLLLWMQVEAWTDPGTLAEMYLEGRSRKTFPTYNCAFFKLWVHSVEIGKSVFNWNEMDVVGHLIMLDGNEASVNMIKQASAVITLLKEVAGLDTKIVSGFGYRRPVRKVSALDRRFLVQQLFLYFEMRRGDDI